MEFPSAGGIACAATGITIQNGTLDKVDMCQFSALANLQVAKMKNKMA
jgi:hypothetical protein